VKRQSTRVILSISFVLAFYTFSGNRAEVLGCNFPPLNWVSPDFYSWAPNSNVHVFIDSRYNETDRSQLAQGLTNWSFWSGADCSGVTFYGFDSMDMSEISAEDMPPANTVWIISQPTTYGGVADGPLRRGGTPERVIAQKIRINTSASNAPQYAWFVILQANPAP
jgi:hypothetical protein